ncbi:MAG: hypothetical protein SPL75_00130 [Bacilli bacterium]|nr:hypothetical protein [Bacilli bacterium]
MKKKLSILFFTLGCLSLIAGFSTTAYSLYTGTLPADKEMIIGIDLPEPTGFYAKVFRGDDEVASQPLVVNPGNDHELMVSGLSLQKGDRFKATDNTNWYGTSTSYSHNISVGASVASSLVTDGGDYVAVQTGTYDVYFKFTDNTYTTYESTYVNVNGVRTIYLQDTWDKGYSPAIHYWGDDVVDSSGDNYVGGSKMTTQDSWHDMYKVVVPQAATWFNIHYNNQWSANKEFDNTNNAYWVSSDGGMHLEGYLWSNPQ